MSDFPDWETIGKVCVGIFFLRMVINLTLGKKLKDEQRTV